MSNRPPSCSLLESAPPSPEEGAPPALARLLGLTLVLGLLGSLLGSLGASPLPGLGDEPSFLVIVADDLGVDNVHIYGEHPVPARTPNIDQLASQGLLFRRAYANPKCSPSRGCLLTGQYAWRTGVGTAIFSTDAVGGLNTELRGLPRLLGPGYRRVHLGKWHLSDRQQIAAPTSPYLALGYDSFRGTWFNLNYIGQSYFRFLKTTDGGPNQTVNGYVTSDTVDDAVFELNNATQPLFLVVALHAPHSPFHDPPSELHGVDTSAGTDEVYYKAMVEAMDTEVGRLLAALDGSALADSTYVFFLGDNGTPRKVTTAPWDPSHAKGTAYEGGIRVPLIACGPGIQPAESDGLVSITDLFTTIVELAGGPLEACPPESVSLVPYLRGHQGSLRDFVYCETYGPNGLAPAISFQRTVRGQRYKVIEIESPLLVNKADEMYDLLVDPLELTDLFLGGFAGLTPPLQAEYAHLRGLLDRMGPDRYK
jgi:arylsulfatase A-like enzyme